MRKLRNENHQLEVRRLTHSIIEVFDRMESPVFLHTSLCEKKVQVGVKIDSELVRLYGGNNPRSNLLACYGPEVFKNCPFSAETET